MLPSPGGDGNWVSFRASDASMLVWKSSKLTSGRKPYWMVEVEVSCSGATASGPENSSAVGAYRPKENREWLFEDDAESMGLPAVEGRVVWRCLVGLGTSLLLFLKQENPSLSATGAMRGCHGVRHGVQATTVSWKCSRQQRQQQQQQGWHGALARVGQ